MIRILALGRGGEVETYLLEDFWNRMDRNQQVLFGKPLYSIKFTPRQWTKPMRDCFSTFNIVGWQRRFILPCRR